MVQGSVDIITESMKSGDTILDDEMGNQTVAGLGTLLRSVKKNGTASTPEGWDAAEQQQQTMDMAYNATQRLATAMAGQQVVGEEAREFGSEAMSIVTVRSAASAIQVRGANHCRSEMLLHSSG